MRPLLSREGRQGMNSRERVLSALAHRGYDRIPVMYQAEPAVTEWLKAHFGVAGFLGVQECLGDDFRYIQPRWTGPQPQRFPDGSYQQAYPDRAWPMVGERVMDIPTRHGFHAEVVYRPFEAIADPAELADHWFPTADCFDYSRIRETCLTYRDHALVTGSAGVMGHILPIGHVRGYEQSWVDIAAENPVWTALADIKARFHMEMFERVLQAAEGMIDIVYTGEDLGTQEGLLISPQSYDRLIAPRFAAFCRMVHRHGARVMMHSCGAVRRLIPRLIDIGLDILQVVQVSAADMDLRELRDEFGDKLAFCGSMDVQTIMPFGTVHDVRREVEYRRQLFPDGGLILGPTQTLEPDTPLDNILAMYDAAGSLRKG